MRRAVTICLPAISLATLLTGCAAVGHHHRHMAPRPMGSSGLQSHLLFDRVAGLTDATELAARDSWPSAPAGRLLGEEIIYYERFRDRQGRGGRNGNDFQRHFTSQRRGRIRR